MIANIILRKGEILTVALVKLKYYCNQRKSIIPNIHERILSYLIKDHQSSHQEQLLNQQQSLHPKESLHQKQLSGKHHNPKLADFNANGEEQVYDVNEDDQGCLAKMIEFIFS
jgi:hypothetical protein